MADARRSSSSRIRAEVAKTPGRFEAHDRGAPAAPAWRPRRPCGDRWPSAGRRPSSGFAQEFEGVAGVFHRVPTVGDVPAAVRRHRTREVGEGSWWHGTPRCSDWTLGPRARRRGARRSGPWLPEPTSMRRRAFAIARRRPARDLGVTGVDFAARRDGHDDPALGRGPPAVHLAAARDPRGHLRSAAPDRIARAGGDRAGRRSMSIRRAP